LGILGAVSVGGTSLELLGVAVAVLAAGWVLTALALRRPYLDLFRQTLRQAASERRLNLPGLDLSSLEAVISTLNSPNDAEVRAALAVLAEEGRDALIPALILYHPSSDV